MNLCLAECGGMLILNDENGKVKFRNQGNPYNVEHVHSP